jgi:hypothetical protein
VESFEIHLNSRTTKSSKNLELDSLHSSMVVTVMKLLTITSLKIYQCSMDTLVLGIPQFPDAHFPRCHWCIRLIFMDFSSLANIILSVYRNFMA